MFLGSVFSVPFPRMFPCIMGARTTTEEPEYMLFGGGGEVGRGCGGEEGGDRGGGALT